MAPSLDPYVVIFAAVSATSILFARVTALANVNLSGFRWKQFSVHHGLVVDFTSECCSQRIVQPIFDWREIARGSCLAKPSCQVIGRLSGLTYLRGPKFVPLLDDKLSRVDLPLHEFPYLGHRKIITSNGWCLLSPQSVQEFIDGGRLVSQEHLSILSFRNGICSYKSLETRNVVLPQLRRWIKEAKLGILAGDSQRLGRRATNAPSCSVCTFFRATNSAFCISTIWHAPFSVPPSPRGAVSLVRPCHPGACPARHSTRVAGLPYPTDYAKMLCSLWMDMVWMTNSYTYQDERQVNTDTMKQTYIRYDLMS